MVSNVVSFAFWYEETPKDTKHEDTPHHGAFSSIFNTTKTKNCGKDSEKQLSALMNFNLWCLCGWDVEHPYLDIGFRIKNLSLAQTLFFYLPLSIPEPYDKYIVDLGEKFEKTELIEAVFNENYSAEQAASSKTIKVNPIDVSKNLIPFQIYELDITHDIELEPFVSSSGYKGTIMKIPVARIVAKDAGKADKDRCDNYYFRFRVKNLSLDFLIHEYTPRHAALQSIFNTTKMIDFRYNNVRSLDKSLVEQFYAPGHHIVKVEDTHLLLITKAYVDVFGEQFKSTREIEHQVWEEYVDNNDTKDLVAYHHVDKGDSSEMFVRLRVEKSVIGIYLLTVVLLGIVSSIIASVIWLHFPSGP